MRRSILRAPVPAPLRLHFPYTGFAVDSAIPATTLHCVGPRNFPCRLFPRCTPKLGCPHLPNPRQSTLRSALGPSFLQSSFSRLTGKTCIPYSQVLEGQHLSVHLFSGSGSGSNVYG